MHNSATITNRDGSILGLNLSQNKKVSFLPVRAVEAFPNLLGYSAWGCLIKTIFKEYFARLTKLKRLALHENQIVKINSGVFEDLVFWKLSCCVKYFV
jgi:hypothetical protein